MSKEKHNDSKEFALAIAKIARDSKGRDVQVIDLRDKSPATYFFVIATTTSGRQGRSISDEINKFAKEHGHSRFGQAGYESGRWILLDFVDVIIHIFDEEYRDYYQLEKLWGDAESIKF